MPLDDEAVTATEDESPDTTDAAPPVQQLVVVPRTLLDLAALRHDALPVIDTKIKVLTTIRKAALLMTYPTDWTKYRADDGSVICYLEDAGADRVRDLFGISIFDVTRAEKIIGDEPGDFCCVVMGSGRCSLTGQSVEMMEGVRGSKEKACEGLSGAMLEARVRKLARANLDGGITRELAGLKSVPEEELQDAWRGTSRTTDRCHQGRGYGTKAERTAARSQAPAPQVAAPVCPHCQARGIYHAEKDGRSAFYGCPNYRDHPQKKFIINADAWIKQQQSKQPPQPAAPAQTQPPAGRVTRELDADDIWPPSGSREPGQEG